MSVPNRYQQAVYTGVAHYLHQLPPDQGREVAFAGRSNAGKSTAINAITMQNSLARTSKTPGRTQQIVFFDVDATHRLVDLPGYGYAKVPEALRSHWRELIDAYLNQRRTLLGIILVMDIRHPLKPFDDQMLAWAAGRALPCHLLLTKADKLSRSAGLQVRSKVLKALDHYPGQLSAQLFSAPARSGLDEARAVLDGWLYGDEASKPLADG